MHACPHLDSCHDARTKGRVAELQNWGKAARGDNPNRKHRSSRIAGGLAEGYQPCTVKESLVKKAQETACQTTLRRHRNFKRTNEIRLFTWNVLSLFRPGSLWMLTDVLSDYRANITAIQELRWVGSGVMQKRDYDLYYCCHYNNTYIFGTGFVTNKIISRRINGFSDFVHRPDSKELEDKKDKNTTFRKLDLIP
jgi:hypothetical protein